MGKCLVCGNKSATVSGNLGVCLRCIREKPEQALEITRFVHAKSRAVFGLPPEPPRDADGLSCGVCANDCRIGEGGIGFCGLVHNVGGRLIRFGGTPEKAVLEWYYDALPTNCVAWWFCAGCTGTGYPKYAHKPGAEVSYSNLAVFYGACSFDCLYCQNWHYHNSAIKHEPIMSAESLAAKANDERVSCMCFFGGDPSPQMPHALETSRIALEKAAKKNNVFRVCWETSGCMNPILAVKAAE